MPGQISRTIDRTIQYPVAAATLITKNDQVMLVGGYLTPCADAANDGAVGIADEDADNRLGAAGALSCKVAEGIATVDGAGFAQSDVGTTAWANGANAVAPGQTGASPAMGPITRFRSATQVDVMVGLSAGKLPTS